MKFFPVRRVQITGLLLPAVVFLCIRFLFLFTAIESTAWSEELYRGTIAREILRGLQFPIQEYQADFYDGGSLVTGFLAAPLFSLLGPNLFALKIVPLGFSFALFGISLIFLFRFFGAGAALAGALLLTFAPAGFVRTSLIAHGAQAESLIFSAILLYGLYSLVIFQAPRRTVYFVFWGAAGGAGFWFSPIVSMSAAACLLSWLCLQRFRPAPAQLAAWGIGFLAGMLPWWDYNLGHEWKGMQFLTGLIGGIRPVAAGGLLIGLAVIASRLKERILLPLWIFFGVFLAVPAVLFPVFNGTHYFQYRHFIPFGWISMILFAALFRRNAFYGTVLLIFILPGIWGQKEMLFKEPFGRGLQYRGYAYADLGGVWAETVLKPPVKWPDFFKILDRFELNQRLPFLYGWVYSLDAAKTDFDPDLFQELLRIRPAVEHRFFAGLLGRSCAARQMSRPAQCDEVLRKLAERTPEEQFFFLDGFVRTLPDQHPLLENPALSGVPQLQEGLWLEKGRRAALTPDGPDLSIPEEAYLEGVGQSLAHFWLTEQESFPQPAGLHSEQIQALMRGAGWMIRLQFLEDDLRAHDWIARLPSAQQPQALEGFKRCGNLFGLKPLQIFQNSFADRGQASDIARISQ